MRTAIRILTALLLLSLVTTGPLAPAAFAQQPMQPAQPAEPAPGVVVTPPAPPGQPELFQGTVKEQRPAERGASLYDAEAAVANAFLIPGRTVTCVLGSAVGVGILALTLGTGYRLAADAFYEGCGGRWVVSGDDVRPEPGRSRPFDWER
jgi:hypothetical protein